MNMVSIMVFLLNPFGEKTKKTGLHHWRENRIRRVKSAFHRLFLEAWKKWLTHKGQCIPKFPGLRAVFLSIFPVSQWSIMAESSQLQLRV